MPRNARRSYRREVAVLKRLLSPRQPGTGFLCGWDQPEAPAELVYLGQVDVRIATAWSGIQVTALTDDSDWQEHLRHAAIYCHRYDHHYDAITPEGDLSVNVHIPFYQMHHVDQALYQLRVLLVNNYEWGDHHSSDGHSWSIDCGEQLAADYFDRASAERVNWTIADCGPYDERDTPLLHFLCQLGTDLRPWTVPYDADVVVPDDTPPLVWVRKHHIARELFPLLTDDDRLYITHDIEPLIAFCLHGLRESQDASFDRVLYLNDIYCACRDEATQRLQRRVQVHPDLNDFAVALRSAIRHNDRAAINATLRRIYHEAPARGFWVVG